MEYWEVYERKGQELKFLGDIRAKDAEDAVREWTERYGDNYGKVVILPMLSRSKHQAFALKATL